MSILRSKSLFDENVTEFRNEDNVLIGLVTSAGNDFIATNHRKIQFIASTMDGAIRFLEQSYRNGSGKVIKPKDPKQKSLFM